MTESAPDYRPFASGVGIFIGIVILWVGSYGVFALATLGFYASGNIGMGNFAVFIALFAVFYKFYTI